MTQIRCGRSKCLYRGTEMCTADRIEMTAGEGCLTFETISPADLNAPFNPRCQKKHGVYKSTNPGRTLK